MNLQDIVNPGYGFRILAKGETIPANAEWLTMDGWGQDISSRVSSPFGCVVKHSINRVPIEVGEGWELVQIGATIRSGDEFMDDEGDGWHAFSPPFVRMVKEGMQPKYNAKIFAVRRRKPEPVKECVMAQEEKREFYYICPAGLVTESQARAGIKSFFEGEFKQGKITLMRAVSSFEKRTAVEIVETKL